MSSLETKLSTRTPRKRYNAVRGQIEDVAFTAITAAGMVAPIPFSYKTVFDTAYNCATWTDKAIGEPFSSITYAGVIGSMYVACGGVCYLAAKRVSKLIP